MDNYTEQIEKYLKGQLEGDELTAFEQKLKTDNEFAQEVEIMATLIKGIQKKGTDIDKERIANFHQEFKAEGLLKEDPLKPVVMKKETNIFSLRNLLAIAASLLLLVFAVNYFSNEVQTPAQLVLNKTPRKEMLQEINATLGNNLGFADGDDDEKEALIDSLLNTGWIYIGEMAEFDKAIPLFEQVLATQANEKRAIHGLAEGYFQKGDYKKAIATLGKLIQDEDYDWINDVRLRYAQSTQMLNPNDKTTIKKWYQMILDDSNAPLDLQSQAKGNLEFLK